MFWKDGLSKKSASKHDHFCNIWKDGISCFQKIWYFFFGRKMKEDDLYQRPLEIWYFLYICVGVTSMALSRKIHIRVTSPASAKKMIFILENLVFLLKYHIDWHPRNGPILSHWRCSTRKGVLRNFAKCTGKDLFQGFFFNKVTGLRPTTLLKRKLWCRCFPVNFAKFLRTLFVQNAHGRLLLEFQLFSILLWRPL